VGFNQTPCLRLVMRGFGSRANLGARLLRPICTPLGGLARTLDDAGRLVENYGLEASATASDT
jgi:hypothetical protein